MMKMSKLLCSLSIVFGLGFSACSKESEPVVSNPTVEEVQEPLSMQIYAYSMLASMDLIEKFVLESKDPAKEHFRSMGLAYDAQVKLQENLLPLAQKFSKDMGFVRADYEEILGSPIISQQELESMQLATMMFGVLLEQANDQSLDPTVVSRKDLWECVKGAIGVNDLMDLAEFAIKGPAGYAVIKTALKTALRLSGKVASRFVGGIGLAFLAIDVAHCMLSEEFAARYEDIEFEREKANFLSLFQGKKIPPALYEKVIKLLEDARDKRRADRQQIFTPKFFRDIDENIGG